MTITLSRLKTLNAQRWAAAKLTRNFDATARDLVAPANKAKFRALEARLQSYGLYVPWWVIAVIKEREAGADPQWLRSIAQGDPWDKVSIHVPKGRGPFKSWSDAGYDALVNCAPHAANWKDWSAGGTLTILQEYNGLGYGEKPSPYIWSGTDQYVKGKYVRDGVYDPEAVDKQLGCAGLLLAMQKLDPTIVFSDAPPASLKKPAAVTTTTVAAATAAHNSGLSPGKVLAVALVTLVLAGVAAAFFEAKANG